MKQHQRADRTPWSPGHLVPGTVHPTQRTWPQYLLLFAARNPLHPAATHGPSILAMEVAVNIADDALHHMMDADKGDKTLHT